MLNSFKLVLISTALLLTSCASIIDGKTQQMTFNSEPDGATVKVSGLVIGKTPITTQLKKDSNQVLSFEKDGYKTYTTQLSTHLNGWFWGNIVIGGFLGSTTDAATGAMHEYSPNQYFITLTPEKAAFGMTNDRGRKIKELVVAFGDDLREELSQGSGETLNAVATLVNPNETDKSTTIKIIKGLSDKTPDDLQLANKIIEFYDIKN